MLELDDIKKMHDKAYTANQITREEAANDLAFYWVTQWDDNLLQSSQLSYRGEFNILRKAGRAISADLADNPVQVDFEPIDETRDDSAELADGLYRNGLNGNTSIEAFEVSETESIVCGVGAWVLYAKYEGLRSKHQIICRKPIYEANNTVFWDPNSKLIDKSDAKYCSHLVAYTDDGYKNLVKELTGEEIDTIDPESFKNPEQSYTFPWITGNNHVIYVVNFYHIEEIKDKIFTFQDPFGIEMELMESDILDVIDDLLDSGFEIISEEEIKRNVCYKYIASGAEILKVERIAGEYIPIIPCFGEHAVVEGEEIWEGITRLAKDPQMLRNFSMSYLAELVSRSPREKPIYYPEQIAGFEDMYAETGIDDNYPYRLQNRFDANGNEVPIGAVGMVNNANIPTSLPLIIEQTRQAVEDIANPGLPQNIADPDISGKAVLALQAKIERQSMIYQQHIKHAKRRDGQVWISMAKEIYDVPRKTVIELPDGTRKQVQIMESIIDKETGEIVTLNDFNNAEFEVYSRIGPSYSSQKEQTVDRLEKMIALMDPNDPVRKILQLKILVLSDGVDFDDVREYVNKQLVMMGVKKPETPEEEQIAAQAKQPKQPDAATLLAMAENKKGDADLLEEKRKGIEMQFKAANDQMKARIDAFDAMTKRMQAQIDAQEAGATIRNKNIDSFGKEIDNMAKIADLRKISDEELYRRATNI
jgi:hypothetical protein